MYSTEEYLLDRALISDSVTKILWYLDRHDWEALTDTVLTQTVHVDYTSLVGGDPIDIPSREQVETWKGLVSGLDAMMHNTNGVIIDLPLPSSDIERPTKAKVTANVVSTVMKRSIDGDPFLQNGWFYEYVLVRDAQVDPKHPWKIAGLKNNASWVKGNMAVVKPYK
ncbi:hypothetical protein BDZ94DRAFT_1327034 [Collybia nuda]|uniref:SnoaL-like domain-containing protein n=1 Tax=Collybia nuda TaxID=64659 RepID=A0A9P5XV98_9AGAR|nr:hypothetical protein BDZ94DRAFT_1327034 [Collybia nuda]